jgi:hypothetical protein
MHWIEHRALPLQTRAKPAAMTESPWHVYCITSNRRLAGALAMGRESIHYKKDGITLNSFILNPKDFWAGVIFVSVGLVAIVTGRDYSMINNGIIGPAYFPTILGSILVLIGAVSVIRSFIRPGEAIGQFALKKAFLVLSGVVLFGVLINGAGLPVAVIALVMLAGLASGKFKLMPFLAVAVGLAFFCVLVFVKGLGLLMPTVGPWLSS